MAGWACYLMCTYRARAVGQHCTLHHHPAWQGASQPLEMLLLGSWVWHQAQLLAPICAILDTDFKGQGALLLSMFRFQKGQRKSQVSALTSNCFYKAWKNTALHTRAWEAHSSFLGVGMQISNCGWGAQQHRHCVSQRRSPWFTVSSAEGSLAASHGKPECWCVNCFLKLWYFSVFSC